MTFRTPRFRRVGAGTSLVLAATAVALVAAGCASTRSSVASALRANVLTVDGTSISRRSLEHDVSALSASSKFKALDAQVASQGAQTQRLFDAQGHATRVLTTSWLNRLANQIVVDHEYRDLHLTATSADLAEGKNQFAQLFATSSATGDPIVAQFPKWFQTQEYTRESRLIAVTRVLDSHHTITQAQMLAFYKQNVGSLCPSGVNVAHILVKTLAEARAIDAQLAAGANFASLAKAKSIDTTSAKAGGSLGCFATGEFVAEFEKAAEKAKVGVPTAPVHSQFGYHVILTTKYVPPSFESLQANIRQQLLSQLNLLQKFVAAGLKKASVHVDPLYGTWNTQTDHIDAPVVPSVRNSRNGPTTSATATANTPTTSNGNG